MSRVPARCAAYPVYLGICASEAFLTTVVFTVNMLYQASVVGLDPLEMILVGTALEGSYFVANVPFGVAADTFSRRVSVIAGLAVMGAAWVLEGAVPEFRAMVAASIILGAGWAMFDGALEAWAADELPEHDITAVFLRGGQVGAIAGAAGIGATVALSLVDLQLAIVTGGAGAILTAAALAAVMPERRPSVGVGIDRTARRTFVAGISMVRRSGTVLAVIGAVAVAGAFSEGFDRLSTPHLLDVGLPAAGGLEPVVWFGLLALGGNVSGFAIATMLRRVADPERRRSLGLISLWSGTIVTVTLFAVAPGFWLAAGALLVAGPLRSLATPLWMGWISDRSDPGTRATVLSFTGQADCLGQVACGPLVGLIAVTFSIEVALIASAFLLVPSVILVAATSGLLARLVRVGTRRTPEMPRSALHYRLLHRGDRAVLQVSGVINEQTCPRLVAAIDQVYQRRVGHLVMDIAGVDPLDEEARRCLLECEHRAHFLNIRFELQPRAAIAATSAS